MSRPSNPIYALALLCLVYLLNFLDRTLIYILFPPIKEEMVFSDFQLALLGTTSFVLFYTLLGVPFGRLADSVSRKRLIAVGLATWSLFSGLTGLATDFTTLFICRVMVGVGEATLGPAAMSLLADWFPAHRRATVQSIYSAGIPLGAAAAFFLGGQIADSVGWRSAFFLLSFPGLALAGLVLLLREPPRGQAAAQGAPLREGLVQLGGKPELRWLVTGYALLAVAANSLSIWIPTFLSRAYGLPLAKIGLLSGVSMAVAGGLATAFGGALADRARHRGTGGRMRFTATAALLGVPLWLGLLFSGAVPVMAACYFALAGLGLCWLGPAAADVSDRAGPALRGLGIGVYFFVVNLVGYGVAPLALGRLSDALGSAVDPMQMRYALIACPVACAAAALVLWRGSAAMDRAS